MFCTYISFCVPKTGSTVLSLTECERFDHFSLRINNHFRRRALILILPLNSFKIIYIIRTMTTMIRPNVSNTLSLNIKMIIVSKSTLDTRSQPLTSLLPHTHTHTHTQPHTHTHTHTHTHAQPHQAPYRSYPVLISFIS